MTRNSYNNRRIARNSMLLYCRSVVTLVISLYTSRIVLEALGFEDFGVYALVGSTVTMFSLFSTSFISSTQRFINIAMERNGIDELSRIFTASVKLHRLLAVGILILFETLGLWIVNTKLNFPPEDMPAVHVVYQLSVVSFLFNVLSVPYNAVITAKERMGLFAAVNIAESVVKLGIAVALMHTSSNRLIFYAAMLTTLSVAVRIFYGIYCRCHFSECRMVKITDKRIYREILGISGWNFLGSSSSIITIESIGIVLNLFFNVLMNAAKGLASQIENVVRSLVENLMMSIRPQLTRSYASGDTIFFNSLVSRGTRFGTYLTLLLCLPLLFRTYTLLSLWLKSVPSYTVPFVRIIMIYILIMPASSVLDTVTLASGRIKGSQITLSLLQLSNLPLMCLALYAGLPPYCVYLPFIVTGYISLYIRLKYAIANSTITMKSYMTDTFAPIVYVTLFTLPLPIALQLLIFDADTIVNTFIMCVILTLSLSASVYAFGITREERNVILNHIRKQQRP